MPRISDLGTLSQLKGPKTIRLSTLPSWDSSRKTTIVRSLAPLVELPSLSHGQLFGVLPEDGTLHALEECPTLAVGISWLYMLTGAAWLDPVAGFIIAAFAIHEGKEAWEGELVEDDDDDD